jgi:hypothetical protein
MDMRAGTERLLASVVQVFGQAQAHHLAAARNASQRAASGTQKTLTSR